MDPNAALENILRGHEIAEHAQALANWLANEGFAPADTTVSSNPARFVAHHCARHYPHVERTKILVRADRVGIWTAPPDGRPWLCIEIWFELSRMKPTMPNYTAQG